MLLVVLVVLVVFNVSCGRMGFEHIDEFIIETDTTAEDTDTVAEDTDTVAEDTDTVVEETDTVAEDTDTVVEETDTVVEETDTVVEETDTVVEETDTVVEETDTVVEETDTVVEKTDTVVEETDTVVEETDTVVEDTDTVLETDCGDYPNVNDPGFISGERYEVCAPIQRHDCVPASQLDEDQFAEDFVCEQSPFCGCSAGEPCGPIYVSEFMCCYVMNVTQWCE